MLRNKTATRGDGFGGRQGATCYGIRQRHEETGSVADKAQRVTKITFLQCNNFVVNPSIFDE